MAKIVIWPCVLHHNFKKWEATQVYNSKWMDKQIVIYAYKGFNHKKEQSIGYSLDETWKCYDKWKKLDLKSYILYDSIYRTYAE